MRLPCPVRVRFSFARLLSATLVTATVALGAAACDSARATRPDGTTRSLPVSLAVNASAAPGAVVEAVVSYSRVGTVVVLARDSVVTNTGGPSTALSLRVNVSPCVNDAAPGSACVLTLAVTLKRNGAVMDQRSQTFSIGAETSQLTAVPVELFEASTINVTGLTAALAGLEPGDAIQLTATALDRLGSPVAGRTATWSVVSGGVSINATSGVLQGVSPGPAVVQAAVGGRTQNLSVTVRQSSVDTLTLAPLDTTIFVGGTFNYRVTAKSPYGVALLNRTIAVTSSNTAVATITPVTLGQSYRANALQSGLVNITATSTEGRNGATVTRTTTLRVVELQGRLSGLVTNANTNAPIAGASVAIRRVSDNVLMSTTTTATNGTWTSIALNAGTYALAVTASGFDPATVSQVILPGGPTTPTTTVATVTLVPVGGGMGVITGAVRDATNNAPIVSATVELRAGSENTTGTVIAIATTSASGTYTLVPQPAGTYTLTATRSGYVNSSVTVTLAGTNATASTIFMSPNTGTVAWRFVLQWGAAPTDLDAHLTGPIPNSQTRFHVSWEIPGSLTQSPFAVLDVDQTSGFGPETITMAQEFPGTYRYFVHNFSADGTIRASNARVSVYRGNTLVATFSPPQQEGLVWSVLEITNGTLVPINTIINVFPAIVASPIGPYNPAGAAAAEWTSLAPWNWRKTTRR